MIVMDHSDRTDRNHTHVQCAHGRCQNHDPEWVSIDKSVRPNPYFFGLVKTRWFDRCCGKPMESLKKVDVRRCTKCGRLKEFVIDNRMAKCLCCGTLVTCSPQA